MSKRNEFLKIYENVRMSDEQKPMTESVERELQAKCVASAKSLNDAERVLQKAIDIASKEVKKDATLGDVVGDLVAAKETLVKLVKDINDIETKLVG